MNEPEEETEVEEQEVEGSKEERQKYYRRTTGYDMFIRDRWFEFKANRKENEKFSAAELLKEFGEKWKALSEEERQRYSELADRFNEERGLNRTP